MIPLRNARRQYTADQITACATDRVKSYLVFVALCFTPPVVDARLEADGSKMFAMGVQAAWIRWERKASLSHRRLDRAVADDGTVSAAFYSLSSSNDPFQKGAAAGTNDPVTAVRLTGTSV
jgi:hypothetical protein